MMRTAAGLHADLVSHVRAAAAAAMRADTEGIRRTIDELAVDGADEYSVAFVHQSQQLVIGLATALNAVLDGHRGLRDSFGTIGCRECGTPESEPCRTLRRISNVVSLYNLQRLPIVDVAEAFRRARLHDLGYGNGSQLVTAMEEISNGFVVRQIRMDLPSPPAVPDPNGERVLIVDKTNGTVTIWPLMPLITTDRQYEQYRQGQEE